MEIIDRVLDTTEKKVFDLMFTKKEFEKWLAENNLEFNTENLKKYKDYCFNWVLENVWEIQRWKLWKINQNQHIKKYLRIAKLL